MNLTNILFDKSGLPENSLSMGGALGLWNIAANKIARLPIYIIFLKQAKDKDLQKFINTTMSIVQKEIANIQKVFKEKGFDYPSEPNWKKKLKDESTFVISASILNDEEISNALKEIIRGILGLETESLRNSTSPEIRDLVYDLLKDDNEIFSLLLKLQKEKNWISLTPTILPQ
jgi:hypothetical protein